MRVVQEGEDDAVTPDPDVAAAVSVPVAAALEEAANTVVGTTEVPLNGRRSDIRTKETNLGDLIADALLARARAAGGAFGIEKVDIGLQNGGGIRNDSVLPAGEITELDTFDVAAVLELRHRGRGPDAGRSQADHGERGLGGRGRRRRASPRSRASAWSTTRPARRWCWTMTASGGDARASACRRSRSPTAPRSSQDGAVVEGAPAVNLATIDFLARGGDQYPFGDASFTPLGVSYQQALSRYIEEDLGGKVTADAYPEGGTGRIKTAP